MPLNQQEAAALGRSARTRLPRRRLADAGRRDRDPVAILEEQHLTRLQDLVPVRVGRMLQSPFACYRGSAAVMAHDLGLEAHTGLLVVSCGDAHVSNFGLFASPERRVMFELNDFDEGGVAPFEWDLKRLAASIHIAGRSAGMSEPDCRDAVVSAVEAYRTLIVWAQGLPATERYYLAGDTELVERLADPKNRRSVQQAVAKARRRTSEHALARLEMTGKGDQRRIVEQPPLIRHVRGLGPEQLADVFARYSGTLRADVALLVSQLHVVDVVLRVVGVGSVGTRCYLVVLEDPIGAPVVLQVKEAQRSVLSAYGGMPDALPAGVPYAAEHTQGQRVVSTQRILQSASDPFLGWTEEAWTEVRSQGPPVPGRTDFYWRQFRDMKGSVDIESLRPDRFVAYGRLCARALARAHVQSPLAAAAAAYLGRSAVSDEAIATWAAGYADQAEADHAALAAAVRAGRLPCETGV